MKVNNDDLIHSCEDNELGEEAIVQEDKSNPDAIEVMLNDKLEHENICEDIEPNMKDVIEKSKKECELVEQSNCEDPETKAKKCVETESSSCEITEKISNIMMVMKTPTSLAVNSNK